MQTLLRKATQKPLQTFVFLLWMFFVGWIIKSGFEPNPYVQDRFPNYTHVYPIKQITVLVSLMCVQAGLVYTIDKCIKSNWKILLMMIISIPFMILLIFASMHAPQSVRIMTIWEVVFLVVLFVTTSFNP